jgi:gliding motility-associated-like protein
MWKSYVYLFLVLMLPASAAVAQKENNIWVYGPGGGIDFNGAAGPVLIPTAMDADEGCAGVCDTAGRLLFYSNGLKVWDSTNQLMPHGTGLLGPQSRSATQGAGIMQVPGVPHQYYLFTVEDEQTGDKGYFRYSLADMTLNNGKGDVVASKKNILLGEKMSEKMILASVCGVHWVITHERSRPVFHAYQIGSSGVSELAVVSVTNEPAPDSAASKGRLYTFGEMKLSPDGGLIALANSVGGYEVSLFHFDPLTGMIRYYCQLPDMGVYSLEFSGDGQKLYVNSGTQGINQYSLGLLPKTDAVRSSKYPVLRGYFGDIRRAPDQKLYFVDIQGGYRIGRINNPDLPGMDCRVEPDLPGLFIPGNKRYVGLGASAVIPRPFLFRTSLPDTVAICRGQQAVLDAGTAGATAYLWNDRSGGQRLTTHKGGMYRVEVTVGLCKGKDSVLVIDNAPDLNLGADTVVCTGSSFLLQPHIRQAAAFIWQDDSRDNAVQITQDGVYSVTATRNGCTETDTVNVVFKTCTDCVRIPNAFTPNGDGRNDLFRPLLSCPAAGSTMIVLNRYGQEVFHTETAGAGWDGTFNGRALEIGSYFYLYRVTFDYPGAPEELYKGDVSLLR